MLEGLPFSWKIFIFDTKSTGRVPVHIEVMYEAINADDVVMQLEKKCFEVRGGKICCPDTV
jgi:hypothetical protein